MKKITRNFIWFFLLMKRNLKLPAFYIVLLFAGLFLALSSSLLTSGNLSVKYGILNDGSTYAQEIISDLTERSTSYEPVILTSREELEAQVASGELDCGFVLLRSIDDIQYITDLEETIEYISSTSTRSGALIKELVFSSLLKTAARLELETLAADGSTFQDTDEELASSLVEEYNRLLESDAVVQLQVETVDSDGNTEEISSDTDSSSSGRLPALYSIMLFAAALCFGRNIFEPENKGILLSLKRSDRFFWNLSVILSAVIPSGILLFLFAAVIFHDQTTLPSLIQISVYSMVVSSLWTLLYASFFRRESAYISSIIGVLLLCILTCPAVIPSTSLLPALQLLRWFFPPNWIL